MSRHRFIPACAGNASLYRFRSPAAPVHPRVCGERSRLESLCIAVCGSSPRVRGTLDCVHYETPLGRFIPACAGNATSSMRRRSSKSVHPRVCGERLRGAEWFECAVGSSPRVRGTRFPGAATCQCSRFIPACAGNALDHAKDISRGSVHPRVCGERTVTAGATTTQTGSSPRVRGTQRRGAGRATPDRFIPACAGNAMPQIG